MNTYELTYIAAAEAGENNISSIQSRIEDILIKNGAVKKKIENDFTTPRKKKLSYEINKSQFGYYATVYFDAGNESIEKISKFLKMDSSILRYLIVSVKGDIPEGVVVSKKEVAQQIDNAIEEMIEENQKSKISFAPAFNSVEGKNQTFQSESEVEEIKKIEEAKEISAVSDRKEAGGLKAKEADGKSGKDKENKANNKEKPEKKEGKQKVSFEDLDKKLDEILD